MSPRITGEAGFRDVLGDSIQPIMEAGLEPIWSNRTTNSHQKK